MSNKIRLGILGGGGDSLIGVLHRIASSMYDRYQLVGGVFNPDFEANKAFAEKIGLSTERVYEDFELLISEELKLPKEERMQVISVLTPNFLHFPMAKKLLENGFNVICEKPLTTTYEEARSLHETLKLANTVFAVTYTYTGYPMTRQMRDMIANGVIGKVQKIDAQYYQGWINPIIHDEEKRSTTWRLNPEKSGISCCIGDIGTHAFDMLEYVSGERIDAVLADLNYLYEDNKMDIDGTVLLRTSNGVKGVICASQIATGEENNFTVMVYGDKAGLKWEQENPNYLYLLEDGHPLRVLKPGHDYNSEISLDGTKMPPGHPEGIFDAMGNIYKGVAKAISGEPYDHGEYPTIVDGVRGMSFIEKAVESHKKGNVWIKIDEL
ncbi:MAG: Gfo/Idh/MocA family oxidoreductase [Flavobacteriaceae bacterium]|nr:Gfo/Idh/MocA family oxidoreductase [Bacteroidia bacterium]MBT8286574.1 Gfo/Idh/MocA family oxidoreductase [Bacteroidia bacterium]NNF75469.1 Gfo/Idh/MocA family oxidoreductase [Flavobacteriaceae bacterium]NNK73934.1 Gfo/Idh/MocA family oxidoreductase [Flavobacteriaceae bacterium]